MSTHYTTQQKNYHVKKGGMNDIWNAIMIKNIVIEISTDDNR